jgi:hypothetical protein
VPGVEVVTTAVETVAVEAAPAPVETPVEVLDGE